MDGVHATNVSIIKCLGTPACALDGVERQNTIRGRRSTSRAIDDAHDDARTGDDCTNVNHAVSSAPSRRTHA